MDQSYVDRYLNLVGNDAKYMSAYFKSSGVACSVLRIDDEKAENYILTYPNADLSFSPDSDMYTPIGTLYWPVDMMSLAVTGMMADGIYEVYCDEDTRLKSGDVVLFKRNGRTYVYEATDPQSYNNYIFRATLNLTSEYNSEIRTIP